MDKHLIESDHDHEQPSDAGMGAFVRMVMGIYAGFLAGYAAVYVAAIFIGLLLAAAMLLFGSCLAALR